MSQDEVKLEVAEEVKQDQVTPTEKTELDKLLAEGYKLVIQQEQLQAAFNEVANRRGELNKRIAELVNKQQSKGQ